MPKSMDELFAKFNPSPDDQMQFEFKRYAHGHQVTADQLKEAYYRLTGVSDRTDDEKVEMVRREMNSMVHRNFPLNRFKILIEQRRQEEGA